MLWAPSATAFSAAFASSVRTLSRLRRTRARASSPKRESLTTKRCTKAAHAADSLSPGFSTTIRIRSETSSALPPFSSSSAAIDGTTSAPGNAPSATPSSL